MPPSPFLPSDLLPLCNKLIRRTTTSRNFSLEQTVLIICSILASKQQCAYFSAICQGVQERQYLHELQLICPPNYGSINRSVNSPWSSLNLKWCRVPQRPYRQAWEEPMSRCPLSFPVSVQEHSYKKGCDKRLHSYKYGKHSSITAKCKTCLKINDNRLCTGRQSESPQHETLPIHKARDTSDPQGTRHSGSTRRKTVRIHKVQGSRIPLEQGSLYPLGRSRVYLLT